MIFDNYFYTRFILPLIAVPLFLTFLFLLDYFANVQNLFSLDRLMRCVMKK